MYNNELNPFSEVATNSANPFSMSKLSPEALGLDISSYQEVTPITRDPNINCLKSAALPPEALGLDPRTLESLSNTLNDFNIVIEGIRRAATYESEKYN